MDLTTARKWCYVGGYINAEAGSRTLTPLPGLDPESSASANSATSAGKKLSQIILKNKNRQVKGNLINWSCITVDNLLRF